jgi:hypothetical protein
LSGALVFPELVTGREDGFAAGPWRVENGSTFRGGASCDLTRRVLEVPLGADATSRVVRAHELMHVRVSPHRAFIEHRDVSARALECAEEFRVNVLLVRLGFGATLLRDGTEKSGGRRTAEAADWPETVRFLVAVLGTGAERDYLSGIRAAQPTWMAALRAVSKRARKLVETMSVDEIGDTSLDDQEVPRGFANVTVALARILDRAAGSRIPGDPESLRLFRRSLEAGARRAPSGVFAPVVFDERGPGIRIGPHASWRRDRPSTSGVTMRFPGRLLTDDQQRAFSTKRRSRGGVVVIDQSGSMDIDPVQLAALMMRSPGALVVGYSHRPGDVMATPNAWILVKNGVLARQYPSGNVGNGVDGPVLAWAVAQARPGEPVVWVTDGQVTDSNDHPSEALSLECATLVRRHRIRLVRELRGAAGALACYRPPVHSDFGRVGRELKGK